MRETEITFNDLPKIVAQLLDEVLGLKAMVSELRRGMAQPKRESRHKPMTPEQMAEYTNIPLGTIYQKLAEDEIPGTKPDKRWVLYLDGIDEWLEVNRKNRIHLTDEKQNATTLAAHKRKPKALRSQQVEDTLCPK